MSRGRYHRSDRTEILERVRSTAGLPAPFPSNGTSAASAALPIGDLGDFERIAQPFNNDVLRLEQINCRGRDPSDETTSIVRPASLMRFRLMTNRAVTRSVSPTQPFHKPGLGLDTTTNTDGLKPCAHDENIGPSLKAQSASTCCIVTASCRGSFEPSIRASARRRMQSSSRRRWHWASPYGDNSRCWPSPALSRTSRPTWSSARPRSDCATARSGAQCSLQPAAFVTPIGPLVPLLAIIISLMMLAGATSEQLLGGAVALVSGGVLFIANNMFPQWAARKNANGGKTKGEGRASTSDILSKAADLRGAPKWSSVSSAGDVPVKSLTVRCNSTFPPHRRGKYRRERGGPKHRSFTAIGFAGTLPSRSFVQR
jgi:hypothetical protein